jgi:hypothetical protein
MSLSKNIKAHIKQIGKNKKQREELTEYAFSLTGSDEDKIRLLKEKVKKDVEG